MPAAHDGPGRLGRTPDLHPVGDRGLGGKVSSDILDCLGAAGLQLAEGDDAAVVTHHLSLVKDDEQLPPA